MNRLRTTLSRLWRVPATGLAFALFGVGAVVISATWFPWLRLRSGSSEATRVAVQRAMRSVFQLFIHGARWLGLATFEVRGVELLQRPGQLVIANHPTLIDVVLLIAQMPQVDCIVKRQLWSNPFLRWPVRWAGYIQNTDPETLLAVCAERLRAGHSLLVFPAGTRDPPGKSVTVKRGAAQIALAARCPVATVRITCVPPTLHKGEAWYRVPERRPHFALTVDAILQPEAYVQADEPTSLAARRVSRLFAERLGYNPPASAAD